jgi:long-chain acyl-CoA synthetase
MDVSRYLDLKPAPRAVFDNLPERATRARFFVPQGDGDWKAVTWAAHAKQIRQVALFLKSSGFKAGERGAVFAPNSVEWMSAALAIQTAGGVMVPIYPASTASQAAYVAEHCDARVLFVDGQAQLQRIFEEWPRYAAVSKIVAMGITAPLEVGPLLESMRAKGLPCPPVAEVERKVVGWTRALNLGAARDAEAPAELDAMLSSLTLEQPGLMLYTSGTSGNPKGVPLTHANVAVNGLDWLKCNAPLLEEGDVDVLWLPMSHIFGFGEACLGNTLGFTTYLSDPMTALTRLPQVKPTVFMSVPALWEKIAQKVMEESDASKRDAALAKVTGGKLRFCLSGGAGLKREVKELFHAAGLLIVEGYGLTECAPTLTLNRPGAFRFDSVGKSLPSVELKLAEDGEILARGPNVFAGYHKDPAATREAFTEDGWFKTGDVGQWTDDGYLQIIDRKKDILVTAGGKNVPPANIELRFKDDPFIAQVVVFGEGQKYLVAGVWLNEAAVKAHFDQHGLAEGARSEAMRALVQKRVDAVNSQLASYETLKKFVILEQPLTVEGGMLTSTLKVRRKQVTQAFGKQLEALYS